MDQMIALPVGGYPFASHEDQITTNTYALSSTTNAANDLPQRHAVDNSNYHHEALLSQPSVTSPDYNEQTSSSLVSLADYGGLASTPLPSLNRPRFPSANQTYALTNSYTQSFSAPSTMRMPSMALPHTPLEMIQPGPPSLLDSQMSPSYPIASKRGDYTTSIPERNHSMLSPRHRRRAEAVPKTPSYNIAEQTPRTVYSPMSVSPQHTQPYATTSYAGGQSPSESSPNVPPFTDQKNLYDLWGGQDNVRKRLFPTINCRVEKGFFPSTTDGSYTCYRRNYFCVACDYSIQQVHPDEPLFVNYQNKMYQVQALGMNISAAVDGANGKPIELIQYTPKRDAGDKMQVALRRLLPTPPGGARAGQADGYPFGIHQNGLQSHFGPLLPLQQAMSNEEISQSPSQGSSSNSQYTATFERIQFKSATANNGKRRAQQQYYHIMVELWADIRATVKEKERWVKIALKTSEPVVVRGRSPSHYKKEDGNPHSPEDFRGAGSAGGLAGAGGSSSSLQNYTYGPNNSVMPRDFHFHGSGGNNAGSGGSYRPTPLLEQPSAAITRNSSASSLTTSPLDRTSSATGLGLSHDHFAHHLQHDRSYEYFPTHLNRGGYDAALVKAEQHSMRSQKAEMYGIADSSHSTLPSPCGRYTRPPLQSSKGHYTHISDSY